MDVIISMGTDAGLLLLSVVGLCFTSMIIVRDTKRRMGVPMAEPADLLAGARHVSDLFDIPDAA